MLVTLKVMKVIKKRKKKKIKKNFNGRKKITGNF